MEILDRHNADLDVESVWGIIDSENLPAHIVENLFGEKNSSSNISNEFLTSLPNMMPVWLQCTLVKVLHLRDEISKERGVDVSAEYVMRDIMKLEFTDMVTIDDVIQDDTIFYGMLKLVNMLDKNTPLVQDIMRKIVSPDYPEYQLWYTNAK